MGWPTITGVVATIATKFGGDITQGLAQLFSNIDIGAIDSTWKPLVNTDFRFRSGRLRIRDNATTPNEIDTTVLNQSGARTIQIPILDSTPNIPVYLSMNQTLTNKTIDAQDNNLVNILPSQLSTSERLTKLNQHVATVYNDQANNFGAFDQKFLVNRLLVANAANNQWAKIGYLGTTSDNFDIPAVGSASYIIAVSKTAMADGDLFYWSGGKPVRLPVGTTGYVLKLSGSTPTWQQELNASGLPTRGYFATDYASSSTMGTTIFQSIAGDASTNTTFNNRRQSLDNDIVITRIRANVLTNSLNTSSLTVGIADSTNFLASVAVTAGTTGLQASGALSVTIPAGTAFAFRLSTGTAASGTYEVRSLVAEYQIGSPGAFGNDEVVVREIGTQVGTGTHKLNFSVGTDFDITENTGTDAYDIKIANDAIKTAHILDGNVTLAKLASDSVDSTKIATNAVGSTEIAPDAVTSTHIAANAVTATEIASNAVTTAKILDANVTGAKLANASVTDTKLTPITDPAKLPSNLVYDWTQYQRASHSLTKADYGDGLWAGIIWSEGTFGYIHSATNYSRGKWNSGGADNNRAGFTTEFDFTRANCNPRLDFYVQGTVANVQRFFGFVSGTNGGLMDLDNFFNGRHLIGFWVDSASTNYRSARQNGGSGNVGQDLTPATTVASGGTHKVSVYTDNQGSSWHVVFNGTDNVYNTTIPAVTQTLGVMACVQNRSAASSNFEVRYCQFRHEIT